MLIFAGIPPFHSCEGRNLFPRSGIPLLSKASITAKIPAFAGMEECDGNPPHSPHIKKAPPFPNSPQIPPSPFPRKRESPDSSGEAANHRQRRQSREIPAFAGMGSMLIFAGIPPFHSCEGRNLFPRSGIPLLSKASITAKIPAFAGMEECDGNPPHSPHIKKAPPFPNSPQIPPSPFPRKRESPDSSGEAANHRQRRQNREIPAFAGMGSMLIFAGIPPFHSCEGRNLFPRSGTPLLSKASITAKIPAFAGMEECDGNPPPFPPFPHIKKAPPFPNPPFPPIPIPAKAGISRLQRRSRESPPKAAK